MVAISSALQNQIHIYSLDTSAFYTEEEQLEHRKLMKSYKYKNHLKVLEKDLKLDEIESKKRMKYVNSRIKQLKDRLKAHIRKNKNIRHLNVEQLRENNIISVFETVLTRTLGIKTDTITEDMVIVRVFYYEVLEDLIRDGFIHKNEKYVYFSSSAGQIRTKKGVWVKESSWNEHKNAITCGLSVKDINKQDGSNINKYLAYIALTNSASTEMKNFDITKTIVVDDLETNVRGEVDYIDRDSYDITRQEMDIPIEHTDGAGMILPSLSDKSFMIRLPFVKGLLIPFSYDKFIEKFNGNNKVKDIYGKEWDIIEDEIQIIFTKSQFKMWKYYTNWEEYVTNFVKYDSQAAMLNKEEDIFNEVKLNYQMIQTLTDITDEELTEISQSTIDDILEIGSDKETMLRVLGATEANNRKNPFQEALLIYPELLNDVHAKQVIKDVKKSLVKNAKAGKLNISGKYTFICPDMFAFCENLFLEIEEPKGLIKNGDVHCKLFDEGKVDMLRSPHLYKEHGVKNNVKDGMMNEWFITNGIYTSVHDTVSKMLQFDVDGDQSLVIDDPTFVKVAERNMKGIVPLYYEMATAKSENIDEDAIYNSLTAAFKANIGEVSNNITKIFNSSEVDLDVVRWLTMENNFEIDYAKTLFKPKRPPHIDKRIKGYIRSKVPHFFIHAKGKKQKNVEQINQSPVNRLNYIIPNKRIYFKKVAGEFDYKMLMKNKRADINEDIVAKYEELNRKKVWLMKDSRKRKLDLYFVDNYIRKELLKVNSSTSRIVDVLVVHLYRGKGTKNTTILWNSFGETLLKNLKDSLSSTIKCENCKKRVENYSNRKYCDECSLKINRKKSLERKKSRKV